MILCRPSRPAVRRVGRAGGGDRGFILQPLPFAIVNSIAEAFGRRHDGIHARVSLCRGTEPPACVCRPLMPLPAVSW